MPYRFQEQFNYCVPASIQMWRAYDGLSHVTQTHIFNTIGGAPCDPFDAASGVAIFTSSGSDAYFDRTFVPSTGAVNDLISRQITSIDAGIPVMPVVGINRNHVGIINGGKYEDHGTYLEWEFVYFHDPDPAFGANLKFGASTWLNKFCPLSSSYCGQIISNTATTGWYANLQMYGDSVTLYGGGGCVPSQCGPPPV